MELRAFGSRARGAARPDEDPEAIREGLRSADRAMGRRRRLAVGAVPQRRMSVSVNVRIAS